MQYDMYGAIPGHDDLRETVENVVCWGNWDYNRSFIVPVILDGAARDAGGSPTTLLRPGLILGQALSAGNFKVKEWNPTGTDGSEHIFGVLMGDQNMQFIGADRDRWVGVLVGGCVKEAGLLVPGQATIGLSGQALEHYVSHLMGDRFTLDNMYHENSASAAGGGYTAYKHKTENYTVKVKDNGSLFTNLGAVGTVTFTLPAVATCQGLRYTFFVAADQTVIVASAAANGLITFNNAAASSVAFQTAGEKIGGWFEVIGLSATKWIVRNSITEAQTITVA